MMELRQTDERDLIIRIVRFRYIEVPGHMRPDLFIQKIKQCTVVFDFSDASAELREKEIKRQTLQEILEHISMNRGVLTENVYPEIVQMVRMKKKA